jgi:hypothetical protein
MTLGMSLVLGAAGAILRLAVNPRTHIAGTFVNWNIVGDILLATGIVGVVATVLLAGAVGRRTATAGAPRAGQLKEE